jgi:Zn-dependent protease/CBS domain-containing protein
MEQATSHLPASPLHFTWAMRGAIRLGKLFGIDIEVDWSWGIIFLLMAWNLTVVFHTWHPLWPFFGCFVLAIVAALLFFASVLAHELAHALVASSYGITVTNIRLFLFGGVSNIEREPPSPSAEFWMAIIGRVVSIGLGFAFTFMSALVLQTMNATNPWETLAGLGPITTLFFWLGPINVMVGVFNLIPGFPLDGGRVLRAALWQVSGDLHRATLTATTVGRIIGWAFVFMGIAMVFGVRIPFFGYGPASGVWIAFIGWFLASAAERSFGALVTQEVLEGVRVAHLMRPTESVVPAETSAASAVSNWFMRSSAHAFPVVSNGNFLGLVTVGDIRKVPPGAWEETPVMNIMTPRERLVVAAPFEDAQSALRKLGELDVDQLPVLDGNTLIGIVSRSDVARWLELHLGVRQQRHIGPPRPA